MSEECREKGNACMKEDKHIEAMFHYTKGIKLEPNNAYLYSNRSLAFLKMQQYCHALEDALTTIKMMPKWAKGYYRKAEIECAAEHYKEAIETYKQGLLVTPDEPGLKEGLVKATKLYQAQRKADRSIPWYGLALGSVVGILLIVFDEGIAKKPILDNDVIRVMVLFGVIGVCYGFGVLYRYFLQSQRASLLEAPPDLLGGGFNDLFPSTTSPASSQKNSSTRASGNPSSEKPEKAASSQPSNKDRNQRKKAQ